MIYFSLIEYWNIYLMKYFIFLLLSVPLLCALPNGKDCQSNNIYEEYTKLKEDYDKIKKHEEWV